MPIPSSPWTSLCHTRAGGVMSPGCDQGAPQTNSPNLAALAAALAAAAGPPTPGQRQQGRISDPGEASQQTWAEPIPQALPASPQGTLLRFSSSLSCPRTTPTPARLPPPPPSSSSPGTPPTPGTRPPTPRTRPPTPGARPPTPARTKRRTGAPAREETWWKELDEKAWQDGGGWMDYEMNVWLDEEWLK